MKTYKYIIVGGGIVAGYAAQEFIKYSEFNDGELAIITDDDAIPYERPPLSKEFLGGEKDYESIQINSPDFYRRHGIKLFLYTRVNQINTTDKTLKTDHGDTFQYEKLLLATGSSAVELDLPGSDHPLVKYLRTLQDARAIHNALDESNQIVVVGGGYIGMETAASLTQDGHQVTMVFPEDALMEQFFTPDLSEFFEAYYCEEGITFVKGATVERFVDKGKRIQAILSNGDQLNADLIVVGVGAKPNLSIIKNSHIEVDDGVVVNRHLQSSVPEVYAAGDIANYYDPIFDKRRRVEHWQNAVDMATYAAREMLGVTQGEFQTLRYFFSDIFDLSYEFWGDIEGANNVIHIGGFDEDGISIWWLMSNRIVAALLINRSDAERESAQRWIREKHTIDPDMFDESISILAE